MPKNIHKGTELNNVRETWERNEKENVNTGGFTPDDNLERVIQEEASEYDAANKEERLLDGDRASVNDESGSGD